jgi:hypothetical protein
VEVRRRRISYKKIRKDVMSAKLPVQTRQVEGYYVEIPLKAILWIDGVSASLKRQHVSMRVWGVDVPMRYLPLGSTLCASIMEVSNASEGSALMTCKTSIAAFLKELVSQDTWVPWVVLEDVMMPNGAVCNVTIVPRVSGGVGFCADEKAARDVFGLLGCSSCARPWDVRLHADPFVEGERRTDATDNAALKHLLEDMRAKGRGSAKDGFPVGLNGQVWAQATVDNIATNMRNSKPDRCVGTKMGVCVGGGNI